MRLWEFTVKASMSVLVYVDTVNAGTALGHSTTENDGPRLIDLVPQSNPLQDFMDCKSITDLVPLQRRTRKFPSGEAEQNFVPLVLSLVCHAKPPSRLPDLEGQSGR